MLCAVCRTRKQRVHCKLRPAGAAIRAPSDPIPSKFAEAYADQNEADYEVLLGAQRDGRLAVESGV